MSAAASPPVLHGNLTLSLFDSCSIEASTLKGTERERRIISSHIVREELRREKKEEKRTQLGGDSRAIATNQQFGASLLVRHRRRRRSRCSSCEHRQTRSCTPEDEMESRKRKRVGSLRLHGGIQRRSAGGDVGLFQRRRRLLPSLFSSSPSGSYSNNYLIRTKVTSQILKTAYPLSPLRRRPAAAHFVAAPHSAALPPLPTPPLSLAAVPSTLTLPFSLADVPSATLSCRSLPRDFFFPSLTWRPGSFRPRQHPPWTPRPCTVDSKSAMSAARLDLTSFIKGWGRSGGKGWGRSGGPGIGWGSS